MKLELFPFFHIIFTFLTSYSEEFNQRSYFCPHNFPITIPMLVTWRIFPFLWLKVTKSCFPSMPLRRDLRLRVVSLFLQVFVTEPGREVKLVLRQPATEVRQFFEQIKKYDIHILLSSCLLWGTNLRIEIWKRLLGTLTSLNWLQYAKLLFFIF